MRKIIKTYIYGIALMTILIIVMYVFGMSDAHISPPFDIGFDQFIDINAGILFICLLGIGFIIYLTFKKR